MKNFIIGDIHGAGQELEGLLDQMAPTSDDRVHLVGDIFDRGLHAHRVWDCLKRVKTVYMGNHEYKTLNWLKGGRDWLPKQYYVALNLLIEHGVTPNELLEWHSGLPWLEDHGEFLVTHAGVVLDNILELSSDMNIFYSIGRNYPGDKVDRKSVV